MDKKEYIDKVMSFVKNKAYKYDIEQEILSHIEDRQQYYTDAGFTREKAEKKALEIMGDPEQIGERMNKLHKNTFALVNCIFLLVVFALCLVYCFTGYRYAYFAVVSTDAEVITINGLIVSFLAFMSGAVCFRLSYKNRFTKTAVVLGLLYIISFFTFCIFLPAGYSIFGFFFDFPAVFIEKDFYFFENELSWGIDAFIKNEILHTILAYTELFLTALFLLSGIVNGIFAFNMAKAMRKDDFYKKEKKYKNFSILLIVITLACLLTGTAEITADYVKDKNVRNIYYSQTTSRYNEMIEEFNSVELPVNNLDLLTKANNDLSQLEYLDEDKTIVNVFENSHYKIILYDNDQDGKYESKRFISKGESETDRKYIEQIDASNAKNGKYLKYAQSYEIGLKDGKTYEYVFYKAKYSGYSIGTTGEKSFHFVDGEFIENETD